MARLIDADSLDITTITTDDYSGNEILDVVMKEDIDNAPTVDAIPIPKGATNGDIQKALYPNASVLIDEVVGIVSFEGDYDEFEMRCSLDWWNAPYKENEDATN